MLTINSLCCLRLHTAGVVIGWMSAAMSLLNIILYIVALTRLDQIIKFLIDDQDVNPAITADTLETILIAGIAIYLTLSVVNLISSVLLIVGTMKERHLMLIPWLISNGFVLFISLLNFVSLIWFCIATGTDFGSVTQILIVSGLIFTIEYIIWTAIYSLFRVIRSSREQQQLIPNKAGSAYPSYTRI